MRLINVPFAAFILLLLRAAPASAEYIPPPTIEELLKADCIATGRFVKDGGRLRFLPLRVLKGDTSIVEDLRDKDKLRIADKDGRLVFSPLVGWPRRGSGPRDASHSALWFFSKGWRSVLAQPIELTPGFEALRGGKKPDALFSLLQDLDFDMRREALEEFFAARPKDLLAELHALALRVESPAADNAFAVLLETRLLDIDRFWGVWLDHPNKMTLLWVLKERDVARVINEIRKRIAAEKDPGKLATLLYCLPREFAGYADLIIRHLDHADEAVRDRALGSLSDLMGDLAEKARTSPDARLERETLGKRLVPLFEARLKAENSKRIHGWLVRLLEKEGGVPRLVRVPAPEPLPPYSEAEELDFLVSRLTSSLDHGFVPESAGREIAERFFPEGFARLKVASGSSGFNPEIIWEGMGYVPDARMFDHLVAQARTMESSDRAYPAILRAIGRQNNKRSFEVLHDLWSGRFEKKLHESLAGAMFDALGHVRDKRALDLLRELEGMAKHDKTRYLRARARHGDDAAIKELLAELGDPTKETLVDEDRYAAAEIVQTLLWVDTAEATVALKRWLQTVWPTRTVSRDDLRGWYTSMHMHNFAGPARRNTPIGEVARRDPRWLAELALKKMEAPELKARQYGAAIFRQLTGRDFDFRADAFASDRAGPLKKLHAWWAEHKGETREEWLLSYFQEKGFQMLRLHDRKSLPVLVRALKSDLWTHTLALEQISIIGRKCFIDFNRAEGYPGPERMTVRVVGWLKARELMPEAP